MKTQSLVKHVPPPDPNGDGVTHINVHYKCATTQLGRMASNYFVSYFQHHYFGSFRCIEGYLCFIKTGCVDDQFRHLTGAQSKTLYRQLTNSGDLEVQEVIELGQITRDAVYQKVLTNEKLKDLLIESTLPFDQYFLFGNGKIPTRPLDRCIISALTEVRQHLKENTIPEMLSDDVYQHLIKR